MTTFSGNQATHFFKNEQNCGYGERNPHQVWPCYENPILGFLYDKANLALVRNFFRSIFLCQLIGTQSERKKRLSVKFAGSLLIRGGIVFTSFVVFSCAS